MSEVRKLHLTVSLSGVLSIEQTDGPEGTNYTVNLESSSYSTHGNLSHISEFSHDLQQGIGQTARELLVKWLNDHLNGVQESKLPQFNTPQGGALA